MSTSTGDVSLTIMAPNESTPDDFSEKTTPEVKQDESSSSAPVTVPLGRKKQSIGTDTRVLHKLVKSSKVMRSFKKRHNMRTRQSFVFRPNQLNPDGKPSSLLTAEEEQDDEHWGRHALPKGTYGGRSVGGKKPNDETQYDQIEAIDFTIHDTVEESLLARMMIAEDPKAWCSRVTSRRIQLWVMYILIGAFVSCFIGLILYICGLIEKARVDATKDVLKTGDIWGAWWTWTGSSLILCLIAVCCVLIEPAAASSGIPGLIAYLNGVMPKGGQSPITGKPTYFTSWETMVAKTLGMICSVPSGIAIGPEGPIIHISALIAHWVSLLTQELEMKLNIQFTSRKSEERDFLATGAACGICTAFRAPLAGVMFVVEEASSFFTTAHLEYTFLACLVAYWTTWVFLASAEGESTVKFKQTTGDFCTYHDMFDYVFFIAIGIIGGCMGALFNQIVEHLNELRVEHINSHAWYRVLEVIFIVLLTGTAAVCLPAAFMCKQELRAIMMEDSAGCLNVEDQFQLSHGQVSHPWMEELLHKAANCSVDVVTSSSSSASNRMLLAATGSASSRSSSSSTPTVRSIGAIMKDLDRYSVDGKYVTLGGIDDVVWLDNGSPYIHLHYGHTYTCDSKNHEYNEMSMLWLNGGVKAVKVLLQRGFPHMLSWSVLLVFCLVYFVLAALTAGISVPAGLVVPMLLIGGSYGRLLGLGALAAKKSMCTDYSSLDSTAAFSNTYYWSTYTRWMIRTCRMPDPGTYAIVGAASFLGGSGRITVMLATVLLELTDDASMIAPVGICCILSMLVGNAFNHGLYHGLIPVFNIPYLNVNPSPESKLAQVKDVMNTNPIVVPKLMHITKLEDLLEKCLQGDKDKSKGVKHHGFPYFSLEKCSDEINEDEIYKIREEVWYEPKVGIREAATVTRYRESDLGDKFIKPVDRKYGIMMDSGGTETMFVKAKFLRKMQGCTHHAFPVVSEMTKDELGNNIGRLQGVISREELLYALVAAKNGDHTLHFVHLLKFCDRSPLTVYPNTRLSRAYSLFQKLGMRHLTVVCDKGYVKGMITRKNLMHYLLTEADEQEAIKIKRVQRRVKLFLARRHTFSDNYYMRHATDKENMTVPEFTAAVSKFKLVQEPFDAFDDVLEGERLNECLAFIGRPSYDTVSKAEFRIFLAKLRQWRHLQVLKHNKRKEMEKKEKGDEKNLEEKEASGDAKKNK